MARTCPDCGLNLDKYAAPGSSRHRCLGGKFAGERKATKLERDKIARGEMDAAELLPKAQPAPVRYGRPTTLPPIDRPKQPQTSQPTTADLLDAITRLGERFDELRATLLDKRRTDA